ncbi:hypothetical protein FI667_g4241, partial [Globisporangium splendens]
MVTTNGAMRKHHFAAQLVLQDRADASSGTIRQHAREPHTRLKQSKRHGELTVNLDQQTVTFVYPKHGRQIFKRTFPQPRKCVVGKHVMRVSCSMGTRSFMYVCVIVVVCVAFFRIKTQRVVVKRCSKSEVNKRNHMLFSFNVFIDILICATDCAVEVAAIDPSDIMFFESESTSSRPMNPRLQTECESALSILRDPMQAAAIRPTVLFDGDAKLLQHPSAWRDAQRAVAHGVAAPDGAGTRE